MRVRIAILQQAQSGICAGCGQFVRKRPGNANDEWAPTFDHVRTRSSGGTRVLTNGLLKHRKCNNDRGDSPATGCDLVWQQVAIARLKKATKHVMELERQAAREAEAERAEARRIRRHMKARTVTDAGGDRYRLWGLPRPPRRAKAAD